ncbi:MULTISPECIES: sulfurtransferase TusA family protein [Marinobacter]|uniref:sulfurtransferase TusA family protein n=1 Tax=Marinobacter TaxID=2742 RepID=UPI0019273634|nr:MULTISPECIES: sulfurtransferase TusA family protein [Marinobacter]MBL3823992.1 sulfurtransferase TusA family protein [Marinobacter sp. MC3]MBL3892148.1 sulfurtransferase TusA family protein [Marinobacter sp. MW3]MCD1646758.1 sulfurtransferase TusA family protein [Marinobacter adhaerens]
MTDKSEVYQIDAVGLVCPLPILRFKKRTRDLPSGTQVDFLADDPTGRQDLQSLCEITGHRIEWMREEEAGVTRYRICLA